MPTIKTAPEPRSAMALGKRPPANRPPGSEPADLNGRNPWLILLVLCGAVFMLLLDTTIVNVAQPSIQEALGANLSEMLWILNSYILTYAVLLLSFGRLGDVFGRKKLFVLGMAIFTAASALCGASHWLSGLLGVSGAQTLIFSRVLQGVGGSLMMPQTLSLITVVFPPEGRGAAMGVWGSVVSLGAITGPIVGGALITYYSWEWVFFINVPIGIIAILATLAIVPESRDPLATGKVDWGGLILSGLGIFAIVFAMIEGNLRGWTDPLILGAAGSGLVLLALFVYWETRVDDPMMKLELFRIRNFWVGNVLATAVSFGMLGIFFPMTLFLQAGLGMSAIEAGLTMVPMSIVTLFGAPIAGRLSDRIGSRWLLVAGVSLMTGGVLFITSRLALETNWQTLLPALLVAGTGMALTFSPMTAAAMSEVPPRIAGSASGILNTTRNIGQVMGIAVLGSVLQAQLGVHSLETLGRIGTLSAATVKAAAALVGDSRLDELPALIEQMQPDQMNQLPVIFLASREAFVAALQDTFHVSAIACAVALAFAFLIQNPHRRRHAEERRAPVAARARGAAD
ncbi:MAG: DHA2 family efflux MFS transporter permease subunit [Thermomicrobiales bacterium]|nr:DHA2 family efflux MFS transporter permease subunit [Thermomicrobiales bacterium]